MDAAGRFLVDGLLESPSQVTEGPAVAIESLASAVDAGLRHMGLDRSYVDAIGLARPGPASATGVIRRLIAVAIRDDVHAPRDAKRKLLIGYARVFLQVREHQRGLPPLAVQGGQGPDLQRFGVYAQQ